MALEFECPYCQATIRVPDNAAGKRGRCPQCAAKITVPKATRLKLPDLEPPVFVPPPETVVSSAAESANDDVIVFDEYTGEDDEDGIGSIDDTTSSPDEVAIPVFGGPSPLPSSVREIPNSVLSKVKRRRKTSAGIWAAVIILVMVAGGIAGGMYWWHHSLILAGEWEAKLVDNPPLPATLIPNAMIQIPAADAGLVMSALERDPLTLVSGSGIATVQFQGSDRGLLVSVQPGTATSLYRVEIAGDERLQRYLQDHRREFTRIHDEDLSVAVNQFLREMKRSLTSKSPSRELQNFRDSVGFAAPVQGLGHYVQAGYRQQIYPCVAEDEAALYFLLPPGVKRFQILGKPPKRGLPFFPGKYEVNVNGSITMKHDDDEPSEAPQNPAE